MSLGADKSKATSQAQSTVYGAQAPFLQDLFSQAQQQFQQFQPNQQIAQQSAQAFGNLTNPQGNPYLNDMTNIYRDQLGLANQSAGGQAALSGGFGGGRQGVAEHLNQQAYAGNVGNFLGQQYQADQNRAGQVLGLGNQVLGLQGQGQQQQALGQYGQAIGGPTVLNNASSVDRSSGFSAGVK